MVSAFFPLHFAIFAARSGAHSMCRLIDNHFHERNITVGSFVKGFFYTFFALHWNQICIQSAVEQIEISQVVKRIKFVSQ